jgi:hypothetical protein
MTHLPSVSVGRCRRVLSDLSTVSHHASIVTRLLAHPRLMGRHLLPLLEEYQVPTGGPGGGGGSDMGDRVCVLVHGGPGGLDCSWRAAGGLHGASMI